MILYTVLTVHLGCVLASLYMHRYVIHRQYTMNPKAEATMKVLYWLLFDTVSSAFVVQHRKHHALSDSYNDPHSPRFGLWNLLRNCLIPGFFRSYKIEISSADYLYYGVSPAVKTSFIDRNPRLGVLFLLTFNIIVFGWYGVAIWLIQLFAINFFTITTITVFGHWIGYRNYDLKDLTRNMMPIGILSIGEELHNNHHNDSRLPNYAVKANEFDLGYFYLRVLNRFNLIQLNKRA